MKNIYSFNRLNSFIAGFCLMLSVLFIDPSAGNAYIVGTSPFEPLIYIFNDPSWTVFSQNTLTMSGFTVLSATGLSYNPVNGMYYAILRVNGGPRRLVTVDPETGVCTDIGSMGANFSSITFTPSGNLYAIAGQGAGVTFAQNLYSVNIATGTPTFLAGPFPLGADGEVIAFNKDDGFLYHWSGNTTANMERIDTGTFVATGIVQSGAAHSEIFGAVYKGSGEFYLTDISSRALTMTSTGFATVAATGLPGVIRGLGYGDPVLPVELTSFTSTVSGNNVTLNWSTSAEVNNSGFTVQRKNLNDRNGVWISAGFVNGSGTTTSANDYSFTDRNLNTGTYAYRLKQIDFNGNFEYHELSNQVSIGVPSEFALSQNYPNPFNPSTTISFDLPSESKVSVSVFDMSGRLVQSLIEGTLPAGYHTSAFNASNLSSGVYVYRLQASSAIGGEFSATKKMTLIK